MAIAGNCDYVLYGEVIGENMYVATAKVRGGIYGFFLPKSSHNFYDVLNAKVVDAATGRYWTYLREGPIEGVCRDLVQKALGR